MERKEYRAKISSKNQLTLPKGVSALLHVGPGDEITFEVTGDSVRLRLPSIRERLGPLIGLHRVGKGKSGEQIMAEIREMRGHRDE